MDSKDDIITSELKKFDFPDDVIFESRTIWKRMNPKMKEQRKTSKLYFFLVFTAYCNLGHPKPPEEIAEVIGINKSNYKKAYNIYSPFDTGLPTNDTTFYPKHYLPGYCKKAGIQSKMMKEMIKFSENMLKRNPSLNEASPSTVSTGIFKYYTYAQGLEYTSEEIKNITGISKGTSDKYYKIIMRLANL
jgi:transcription initiation factor TFIIIB Brf1 subunit/transcription initiation factor TFIIB